MDRDLLQSLGALCPRVRGEGKGSSEQTVSYADTGPSWNRGDVYRPFTLSKNTTFPVSTVCHSDGGERSTRTPRRAESLPREDRWHLLRSRGTRSQARLFKCFDLPFHLRVLEDPTELSGRSGSVDRCTWGSRHTEPLTRVCPSPLPPD